MIDNLVIICVLLECLLLACVASREVSIVARDDLSLRLECFEMDFSTGAVRMTALIYCYFQCSSRKFQLEFPAGALRLKVIIAVIHRAPAERSHLIFFING